MKLWTKLLIAAMALWAIAMTIYAQIQVKEASKLGFELGVLDERLNVAHEEAERQADIAAKAYADAQNAQAMAQQSAAEALRQQMLASEALAACERKKK
jgi:hypothetical protein